MNAWAIIAAEVEQSIDRWLTFLEDHDTPPYADPRRFILDCIFSFLKPSSRHSLMRRLYELEDRRVRAAHSNEAR